MNLLNACTLPLTGRHLVEASAGTGKTWTIATLYVRLVVEAAYTVDQLLVVTYTKAATAELRERLRSRLREALELVDGVGVAKDPVLPMIVAAWAVEPMARERLEGALRDFDLAPVVTIHSFCQRALLENAFESGASFDVALLEDDKAYVLAAAQDLWTTHLWQADKMFVDWITRAVTWREVEALVRTGTRATPPRLLPHQVPISGGGFDGLRSAFEALRVAWDGAAIAEAVAACVGLKQTSYKPSQVHGHARRVDAAVVSGRVSLRDEAFWKSVAAFSRGGLEAGLKAKVPVETLPIRPEIDACSRLLEARAAAIAAAQAQAVALYQSLVREAPAALERVKRAHGDGRFFDDLIRQLADALRAPGRGRGLADALRSRFPVALIDEFQDTDPAQWEVFSAIHPARTSGALYLIGDPKQAIYGFRGADLHAYLGAAREVMKEGAWGLGVNRRSDEALVEAVNQLFSRPSDPFGQSEVRYPAVEAFHTQARIHRAGQAMPALELLVHPSTYPVQHPNNASQHDVPEVTATHLVELLSDDITLEGRPLRPGDVAVLVATNRQGGAIQDALRRRGVPSVRHGTDSVLASEEAGHIVAILQAATHPNDLRAVRAAWITPLIGADAAELHRLEHDERALQEVLQEVRGWQDVWSARGFMRMFQGLVTRRDALAHILRFDGGDRVVTNLRHVAELVHAEEQGRGLRPLAALAWLVEERQRAGTVEGGASEMRLESDAAAVQIITMHKSKGLEYPVVYCPYLWRSPMKDRFPTWHDGEGAVMQLHPEADPTSVDRRYQEARAEALRLAYVALTRAKHLCVVQWGRFNWSVGGAEQAHAESPLAHLLHPPSGALGSDDERVAGMSDREMVNQLQAWAAGLGGKVHVRWTPEIAQARWRAVSEAVVQRPLAELGARRPPDTRLASFSSLVRGAHEAMPDAWMGKDRDGVPASLVSDADRPEPLLLDGFPAGAQPGTAWHAIFEHLDFAAGDVPGVVEGVVSEQLAAFGLDVELVPLVSRAVREVLAVPLAGAPALDSVQRQDRLDELEFAIGVGQDAALVPGRLADAMASTLPPSLAGPVAERTRRLGFTPIQGALRGFVDLIYRQEGRYWLVDYKTNHLGASIDAYDEAGLNRAMIEGDYVLQYHIYAVALRRHLQRRVPGFSWDRDFGGVRYLFVRGMTVATAGRRGVFVDRPDTARLDALERALSGMPS